MAAGLSNVELEAATFLESVYAAARAAEHGAGIVADLPSWVDPDNKKDKYYQSVRESVVSDAVQQGPLGGHLFGVERKVAYYKEQLLAIMPRVAQAARAWAAATLTAQELRVGSIANIVATRGPQLAIAGRWVRAMVSAATFALPLTSSEEHQRITGQIPGPGTVATRLKRVKYMVAVRKLRQDSERAEPTGEDAIVYRYLAALMAHPRGVEIVDRFARSEREGADYALETIEECTAAIRDTRADLDGDAVLIWRFPTAVAGGVASLGLAASPALTRFALAWGRNQKSPVESALEVAGNAIFALSLLGGSFAVASEVLDFVLSVAQTAVAFVGDLEQDQAAGASAFSDEADKLSTGSRTVGNLLKGAAAIVVAIAAPKVVSAIARRTGRVAVEAVETGERAALRTKPPKDLPDPRGIAPPGGGQPVKAAQREVLGRGLPAGPAAIREAEQTAASDAGEAVDRLTARPAREPKVASRVPKTQEPASTTRAAAGPSATREAAPPRGRLDPSGRGTTAKSKSIEEPPVPRRKAAAPSKQPFTQPAPSRMPAKPKPRQPGTKKPAVPAPSAEPAAAGKAKRPSPAKEKPVAFPANPYEKAKFGGTPRVRSVDLLETELSRAAHAERLRLMKKGEIYYTENLAAIEYYDPRTKAYKVTLAKSNGTEHAERAAIQKLRDELGADYRRGLIRTIYTERIPCGKKAANCYGWITKEFPHVDIEYSFAAVSVADRPGRVGGQASWEATDQLKEFYVENFTRDGDRIARDWDSSDIMSRGR